MTQNNRNERSVVITGIGVICPLGTTVEDFRRNLLAGVDGVTPVESLSYSPARGGLAGEVKKFEPGKLFRKDQRKFRKVMCREIEMGVVSANIALDDAGVAEGVVDPERLGVEFGTSLMLSPPKDLGDAVEFCVDPEDKSFHVEQWKKDGAMKQMEPLWLLKYLPNMPACHIGISADARGPNNSITLDDAAGNQAIREGARIIARNHADIIIAGGTGTRLHSVKTMHAVLGLELDPTGYCRPFDSRRNGESVGEAACTLILEAEDHAAQRGARILGRILGASSTCGINPSGEPDIQQALESAMRAALKDAGLRPADVGHIHAQGAGTKQGDLLEARAIHAVFGELGATIPVTSIKGAVGNSGSGVGTLQLAASLLAVTEGVVPPTLHAEQIDPACNLNVVSKQPLPTSNKVFLSVGVTRQGQASAIVAAGA